MTMKKSLLAVISEMIAQGIDPVSKEQELWERFGERHAILVLDSTGFTRTTNQFGIIHFLSRLAQKRNIAIPIIEKHDSEIYITEADSIIALFPSVQNALDAILEIHHTIREKKLMLSDDEAFQVCAGIGYGDLLVTGEYGDFYGPEMNLASKLGEDSAEANELMLTEAAYAELDVSMQEKFIRKESQVSGNSIPYYLKHMPR